MAENDLLDDISPIIKKRPMPQPFDRMPMPKPLARAASDQVRGHYRSRSDLAHSININTKWMQ